MSSQKTLKINPEGARLLDIKKKILILKTYPIIDKSVIVLKIPRLIHAAGT